MKPSTPRPTRRQFLSALAAGSLAAPAVALGTSPRRGPELLIRKGVRPIAISSGNGMKAVELAITRMQKGVRPVDAAVAGVNLVENDPRDMSVGYGGRPNADGVVELDSCVMDGPTHLAGAVAALRNIKNPSLVALEVMRRTDHVLLVGEGALRFARMHGFKEENLLTEASRKAWLRWRETLSKRDDWVTREENELPKRKKQKDQEEEEREHGTIHLSALNSQGTLGAVTTTSGLAYKIPGRVGDSPLIGCGMWLDNDIGSAGSTGRGEAVILSNGSAQIVEQMRQGKSPTDACLELCKRIAHYTRISRLLTEDGKPNFHVNFYAINKKGEWGGASLYPASCSLATEDGVERKDMAALYDSRKK